MRSPREPARPRADADRPVGHRRPSQSITLPLLLWLGIQLATVALVSSRFPLWAKYPRTSEQLTLAALLCVQVIASALLFPILLRDRRATLGVIATAWPFAFVASAVSSTPWRGAVTAECYVALWVTSLAMWRVVLRSDRARATGIAIAICLALSAPIYHYLVTDFATSSAVPFPSLANSISPVAASSALLDADQPEMTTWLLPALMIATAGVTIINRYRAARSVI